MTNGNDYPPNAIIGKCPYCKKPIKNIDRFWEETLKGYVHLWCSKEIGSDTIKKIFRRKFPERIPKKFRKVKK